MSLQSRGRPRKSVALSVNESIDSSVQESQSPRPRGRPKKDVAHSVNESLQGSQSLSERHDEGENSNNIFDSELVLLSPTNNEAISDLVSGKRIRKPRVVFDPFEMNQPKKDNRGRRKGPKHNVNEAINQADRNIWKEFIDKISKEVNNLLREMHYQETFTQSSYGKITDMRSLDNKIISAKLAIINTLKEIQAKNQDHIRWPELQSTNESSSVDVENIFCSLCQGEATDDNDILLCDRINCYRAYHQNCLDPPIKAANIDPKMDWFCWQCECFDTSLDIIGEKTGVEGLTIEDVFPEVQINDFSENLLSNLEFMEDEDEEDEDYDPSVEGNDEVFESDEEDQEDKDNLASNENSKINNKNNELNEDGNDDDDDDDDDEEDSEGSDDEEGSSEEDIDNDELQGLLADADLDINIVELSRSGRKLRSQKQPEEFIQLEGEKDIGKSIARIIRGVYHIGKIVNFTPSTESTEENIDGIWTISFDDITEEELSQEEIKVLLRDHDNYRSYLDKAERKRKAQDQIEAEGKFSKENVISGKRQHNEIDYVQLSLQMFGDLNDEEEDDGDYDPQAKKKKKETQSSASTSSLSATTTTLPPPPKITDSIPNNEEMQKEEVILEEINKGNSVTIETMTPINSIISTEESNLLVDNTEVNTSESLETKELNSNDINIDIK